MLNRLSVNVLLKSVIALMATAVIVMLAMGVGLMEASAGVNYNRRGGRVEPYLQGAA